MSSQRSRLDTPLLAGLLCLLGCGAGLGCVTVAEFRKLERQVIDIQRGRTGSPALEELADAGADSDVVRAEMRQLSGRVEVAEKLAEDSAAEVRRLRTEVISLGVRSSVAAIPAQPQVETEVEKTEEVAESVPQEPMSAEVKAYRVAYATWRGDDHDACIQEFRSFMQTYPASPYADDSAFWMADCHFKQGDYKNAVLRFDDVVRNYPTGNKAPDALYREGESLLKLGPSYHEAAKRAFQRVLNEYPDSARAREAKSQLELISAG